MPCGVANVLVCLGAISACGMASSLHRIDCFATGISTHRKRGPFRLQCLVFQSIVNDQFSLIKPPLCLSLLPLNLCSEKEKPLYLNSKKDNPLQLGSKDSHSHHIAGKIFHLHSVHRFGSQLGPQEELKLDHMLGQQG